MDKFKITVGIEPTDKYVKAKQDLLQAWKSFGELTPAEREVLVSEVIGAEKVTAVKAIFGVR